MSDKVNPFKVIAHAAGSKRGGKRTPKTEADKWNNKALRKAIVSLESLATGKRLVSKEQGTYRSLNAGTTAETVFQLLKQGVCREVIQEHASAGELVPLAKRYDWKSIFKAAEEQGVSLFQLAKERGASVDDVAHLFGFADDETVVVPSEEAAPEAKPAKRRGKKAA
jgi:hypothetical protein